MIFFLYSHHVVPLHGWNILPIWQTSFYLRFVAMNGSIFFSRGICCKMYSIPSLLISSSIFSENHNNFLRSLNFNIIFSNYNLVLFHTICVVFNFFSDLAFETQKFYMWLVALLENSLLIYKHHCREELHFLHLRR